MFVTNIMVSLKFEMSSVCVETLSFCWRYREVKVHPMKTLNIPNIFQNVVNKQTNHFDHHEMSQSYLSTHHRWCWCRIGGWCVCFSQLFLSHFFEWLQKVTFRCCRGSMCVKHHCVFCILTWSWFSCWGDKRATMAESPDLDLWSSVNTGLKIIIKKIYTHINPYLLRTVEVVFCPLPWIVLVLVNHRDWKSGSFSWIKPHFSVLYVVVGLFVGLVVLLNMFYLNSEGWLCFVSFWCCCFPSAFHYGGP